MAIALDELERAYLNRGWKKVVSKSGAISFEKPARTGIVERRDGQTVTGRVIHRPETRSGRKTGCCVRVKARKK